MPRNLRTLAGSTLNVPPGSTELEVSIFGPGYGECVVAHLGFGDWLVVDSCLDRYKKPAALSYLELLGIDVVTSVRLVVATHWHDDHVRGLADLLGACRCSDFWMSNALRNDEFKTLISIPSLQFMAGESSSGVQEFWGIVDVLRARNSHPNFATANLPMWTRTDRIEAKVYALSPSQLMLNKALQSFGQLVPSPGEPKRRLPDIRPNSASVAMWLEVGHSRVLLGADLEETGVRNAGWSGVVFSNDRPKGQAMVFKIPHHGSESSHCEAVWNELLCENPLAALTPFCRGKKPLPSPNDVRRILDQPCQAFATAPIRPRRVKLRGAERRSFEEATRRAHYTETSCGQVRFRIDLRSRRTPTTECFHGAGPLHKVLG